MRDARKEMYRTFMSDKDSEVTRDLAGIDPYLHGYSIGELCKKWSHSRQISCDLTFLYHEYDFAFTLYREIVYKRLFFFAILKLTKLCWYKILGDKNGYSSVCLTFTWYHKLASQIIYIQSRKLRERYF